MALLLASQANDFLKFSRQLACLLGSRFGSSLSQVAALLPQMARSFASFAYLMHASAVFRRAKRRIHKGLLTAEKLAVVAQTVNAHVLLLSTAVASDMTFLSATPANGLLAPSRSIGEVAKGSA